MSEPQPMEIDSKPSEKQVAAQISSSDVLETKKPRFEVRKWSAVAFWSWDIIVETCAICRNNLMEPCIECQPNNFSSSSDECITAWGSCAHAFHHHCISRWLKTRNVCPLDNKEWSFDKFGK